MSVESDKDYQEWLLARPPHVRAFIERYDFRPGDYFQIDGRDMHVMGFSEMADGSVGILVTPIDPGKDYDGAKEAVETICGHCAINLIRAMERYESESRGV